MSDEPIDMGAIDLSTGSEISQKVEVTVDRIDYRSCNEGFVAFRQSTPEKTFYGASKHDAKVALLTAESGK